MTQKEHILQHLRSGKSITQLSALNLYGCMRLAALIHIIRKQLKPNEDIISIPTGKQSYSTYKLTKIK